MTYYYLAKLLYGMDQPSCDQRVLDLMREKWQAMVNFPWQCSSEDFDGGSRAHIYGMYPGYLLSAYVLGVRRDAPVADKRIRIEPHLADLTHAEGVVVSEFGPVSISWRKEQDQLSFDITVPGNVGTTLALPLRPGRNSLQLDGKNQMGTVEGARLVLTLSPGKHVGVY